MPKINAGWEKLDTSPSVWTYWYSFGSDIAKSIALLGPEGFIVVSPPCGAPDAAFDELEKIGPIAALVASNAFHTLGIVPWKKRFPAAKIFAPAQSVARVKKKTGLQEIEPLSKSTAFRGPSIDLVDIPHYRTGEALVRARGEGGPIWYFTDIMMNFPKVPKGPVGLLFKWTGSAPGLKPNAIASLFMMKDKKAVYRWLREEVEKDPPSLLIPSHGPNIEMPARGKELREALTGY